MKHILHIIGYFLIWFAINHKRDEKSTIVFFTKDWLILLILVVIAGLLIGA